jgi:hypothetical protein
VAELSSTRRCLYERSARCGRLSKGEDAPLAFTMLNVAIRCESIAHPPPYPVASLLDRFLTHLKTVL